MLIDVYNVLATRSDRDMAKSDVLRTLDCPMIMGLPTIMTPMTYNLCRSAPVLAIMTLSVIHYTSQLCAVTEPS